MFRKFVFVLTCLFIPMMAFANQEKIYVQLEDLIFEENGIWFKNSGMPVAIGAAGIHVDSSGYYISKSEQTWKCPKCGFVNPGTYPGWGCQNCDFPYDFNH